MAITKRKVKSVKCVYWNANGIKNKFNELEEYTNREEFDIILIGETHLTQSVSIKLPNYNVYRNDRLGRPGGGTCILIKRSIAHRSISTPNLNILEATIVEIDFFKIGAIRLISAYYPPNKAFHHADYATIFHSNTPTLLIGDLNGKHTTWNNLHNNIYGNDIVNLCNNHGLLVFSPNEATHFSPNGSSSTLDICLNKNVTLPLDVTSEDELSSDHNPIKIQIGDEEFVEETKTGKTVNWPKFKEKMKNFGNIQKINTIAEPDKEINHLINSIQNALATATSTKVEKSKSFFNVPATIKNLINEKRAARKIANRANYPIDKQRANHLNKKVKSELNKLKNENWTSKLESLNTDKISFWKMSKILTKKKVSTTIQPLVYKNKAQITNKEKAETFADILQNQFNPNIPKPQYVNEINKINNKIEDRIKNLIEEQIGPTTPEEISQIIQKLNNKKAPGPDQITNKSLKQLPPKIIIAITSYTNAILRLKHFPEAFKKAHIIMIPKPQKDHSDPNNYRPISLLSSLGKIIETIVLKRLKQNCEDLEIIPNFQFGFRSRHSTEHQVLRIVEYITEGFGEGETTAAIFLDISRAFDRIWHAGLIHKLIRKHINGSLVKLIHSLLTNGEFCVKVEDSFSNRKIMKAGTPQGALISPLLYNIYTSDMPKPFDTILATYADDTAIMTSEENPNLIHVRLQRGVNQLIQWFDRWRLKVNSQKSVGVIFTKKRKNVQIPNIQMENNAIKWSDSTKYLGITLDKSLTFATHITEKTNQARGILNNLYCLLGKNSNLNIRNKLLLYTSIIRPMMTHGAPVWAFAAKTNKYKMAVLQNKVLRIITNAPWFIRNSQLRSDLKIPSICDYIKLRAEKLFTNAESHENPLIRKAVDYETSDIIKHKRPKMVIDE